MHNQAIRVDDFWFSADSVVDYDAPKTADGKIARKTVLLVAYEEHHEWLDLDDLRAICALVGLTVAQPTIHGGEVSA